MLSQPLNSRLAGLGVYCNIKK